MFTVVYLCKQIRLYEIRFLVKKSASVMKLAKKSSVLGGAIGSQKKSLICNSRKPRQTTTTKMPIGFLPVYVGEEEERFVIPASFLSHPLFRMLLDKAYTEYGFQQRNVLSLPCSVCVFREVVSAVESCHGQFDFRNLVEEFM